MNAAPEKFTSSPRSSARMMVIASRSAVSERLVGKSHALDRMTEPGADAEPHAAAGQFVKRADLHGDQRRMPAVGIEHAGADALRPGRKRAGTRRRHDAARERILREPDRVDAGGLGGARLLDAQRRRHAAVQPDAQPRQLRQITPRPGADRNLAGEKCACTTRHWPSSLRNTMVERETNSWLL